MEKRVLYLYINNSDYNDIIAFLKMYKKVTYYLVEEGVLIVHADLEFSLSDFSKLRELVLEELLTDFVGLYLPIKFDLSILDLKRGLSIISNRIYDISSFITEICLGKEIVLQKRLRSYYYNLVGIDNINTIISFVENSFNASLTSKKLYLHRNTLNYRLEHFYLRTEMDIKSFHTGQAMYLLFRRWFVHVAYRIISFFFI